MGDGVIVPAYQDVETRKFDHQIAARPRIAADRYEGDGAFTSSERFVRMT
jgi:hypothetical protein